MINQVITAEEFWSDYATPFIKQQNESNNSQEIGVSSSFLVFSIHIYSKYRNLTFFYPHRLTLNHKLMVVMEVSDIV